MTLLTAPIDPAPREYPSGLQVNRRSTRGPASAPETTTLVDIAAWLLSDAMAEDDLMLLFESLAWRLKAAGLAFERSSLSVGTLHPQLVGFSWIWNARDGLCDEIKVRREAREREAYRNSPLYQAIELGEQVRCDPQDPVSRAAFPLMQDLVDDGFTDYCAMPMRTGGNYHNVVTLATRHDGGFPDQDLLELKQILSLFALHVERHILNRIAGNVMDTYLGHAAGEQVLNGAIIRGAGEPVRAVIWAADLRGFTDLSDRLAGEDVMEILNAYFERQAGAVMDHGGEVLKFIGDGMLAVFPYACADTGAKAAQSAVNASRQVLDELDKLNQDPPPELKKIKGWGKLRCGIGLHAGDVFFGNVGAPERLDFTVIGRAVNIAARIEDLTKTIGQPVLVSEEVAGHLSCALEHHGHHRLRGLSQEVALFSPQCN